MQVSNKEYEFSAQRSSKEKQKAIYSTRSRVTCVGTRSWVLVLGF